MMVIASVMPKWRFEAANVDVPQGWNVLFVNPMNDEELISACKVSNIYWCQRDSKMLQRMYLGIADS